MRKVLFWFVLFFFIFNFFVLKINFVFSQSDEATCDLCGYCPPLNPPGDWQNCCLCLYPQAGCADPTNNSTLKVINNNPITPAPGRWWGLGQCISFASGFTSEGAASSLTQTIINLIGRIAGGIAFIYLIYGSVIFLTSQSEPEKINHAKKIIAGALIGLIISLGAVFIINLIASKILKIPFMR